MTSRSVAAAWSLLKAKRGIPINGSEVRGSFSQKTMKELVTGLANDLALIGSYAFRLAEVTKVVGVVRGVRVELVVAVGSADALREQCEAAL